SALARGTQQGVGAFAQDISTMGVPSVPGPMPTGPGGMVGGSGFLPIGLIPQVSAALSSPDSVIAGIQAGSTRLADFVSNAAASSYGVLLPTADIANALVTTAPSYDFNLFLSGLQQALDGDPVGGLIYALGAPVAADIGVGTFGAALELQVLLDAVNSA